MTIKDQRIEIDIAVAVDAGPGPDPIENPPDHIRPTPSLQTTNPLLVLYLPFAPKVSHTQTVLMTLSVCLRPDLAVSRLLLVLPCLCLQLWLVGSSQSTSTLLYSALLLSPAALGRVAPTLPSRR